MGKVLLFIDLLRKGSSVADPASWKNRTVATLTLVGLLTASNAVAKSYGYDLGLSDVDLNTIAAGVAVVVGMFSTYATSDKVGILPAKAAEPPNDLQAQFKFDHQAETELRGGP